MFDYVFWISFTVRFDLEKSGKNQEHFSKKLKKFWNSQENFSKKSGKIY